MATERRAERARSAEPGATRQPVLIAGVPRSGTTWVGQALGHTDGAVYVNEPDGDHDPFAFRARLGRLVAPVLEPGDDAPDFSRLWAGAFAGGRYAGTTRDRLARALYARVPVPVRWEAWLGGRVDPRLRVVTPLAVPRVAVPEARHVVVKSVRAELALDWVADRFGPTVLVVERNPLNVLASWIELDFVRDPREADALAGEARRRWGVPALDPGASQLERQAFAFGVRAAGLRDSLDRHPEWIRTTHEALCVDSEPRFAALAGALGLTWGDAARDFLAQSDAAGSGYRTRRPTSEQPDRWRERLDAEQVATIRATLARFPHRLLDD
jgi:hypothetical protein